MGGGMGVARRNSTNTISVFCRLGSGPPPGHLGGGFKTIRSVQPVWGAGGPARPPPV